MLGRSRTELEAFERLQRRVEDVRRDLEFVQQGRDSAPTPAGLALTLGDLLDDTSELLRWMSLREREQAQPLARLCWDVVLDWAKFGTVHGWIVAGSRVLFVHRFRDSLLTRPSLLGWFEFSGGWIVVTHSDDRSALLNPPLVRVWAGKVVDVEGELLRSNSTSVASASDLVERLAGSRCTGCGARWWDCTMPGIGDKACCGLCSHPSANAGRPPPLGGGPPQSSP